MTTVKMGRLSFWTKLVYGTGDWGTAGFGTLRQIFYAIFLTDVVGLDARLASVAALIGIVWDAINDPLVGMLSDRVRTRWGRRRPFLLWFAIPYGAGFLLLWWAPPFEGQLAKMIFVTLAFMIADTLETLVAVPFSALTPELTPDYDERTSLTGFRMFFNLAISLATAVGAPMIVDAVVAGGGTQQQGYLVTAAIFGGMAAIPFLLIFFVVREHELTPEQENQVSFIETVRTAWANIPFRFATLVYMLNWITFDLVALVLPFYLLYWISSGNLLAQAAVFGVSLPIESAVFAVLLITSVLVLPVWVFISNRFSKQIAYMLGMIFWAVVQLVIFSIQPGNVNMILFMSFLAGISVSSAHILPDAMFPDVIEWDELRTRRRSEGIYYGVKNFIRKLTGALAIFIGLQVLGWFGYQSPPEGAAAFQQSGVTLTAIRVLIGPFGAVLLFSAVAMAWFYPLTRERHARVRKLLEQRKARVLE
ncbi:MAG: putative glycoside/cation symporter YagG [Anaerolineales bacterium]|nr:putative glycoside/cation symporter YagG [Anaerolineales bacterium]